MNTGQFIQFSLPGRLKMLLQELELCLEVIAQAHIATAWPHKPYNLKRHIWKSQKVSEHCSLGLDKGIAKPQSLLGLSSGECLSLVELRLNSEERL